MSAPAGIIEARVKHKHKIGTSPARKQQGADGYPLFLASLMGHKDDNRNVGIGPSHTVDLSCDNVGVWVRVHAEVQIHVCEVL